LYSEGVPRSAWEDQAETTSRLFQHFSKARRCHETLVRRGQDIRTLLKKYKPKEVRVLVELPNRKSLDQWLCNHDFKNQIHDGAVLPILPWDIC